MAYTFKTKHLLYVHPAIYAKHFQITAKRNTSLKRLFYSAIVLTGECCWWSCCQWRFLYHYYNTVCIPCNSLGILKSDYFQYHYILLFISAEIYARNLYMICNVEIWHSWLYGSICRTCHICVVADLCVTGHAWSNNPFWQNSSDKLDTCTALLRYVTLYACEVTPGWRTPVYKCHKHKMTAVLD